MPKVTESFAIDQAPQQVWDFLQDVPEVVTCMPGLELLGQTGDETYRGKITIKLGPVAAAFEGEATIVESDAAAMRARIESKGIDKRGGNRASASVTYWLEADEAATRVNVEGDVKLTGALAQMGRTGIITDVAHQMIGQFADGLRGKLGELAPPAREAETDVARSATEPRPAPPRAAPAEIRAERLILVILWRRIAHLFRALFSPFAGGRAP